jgi:malate dehydrogenase (oxaloacetate-decarboxylating)(NADP+)
LDVVERVAAEYGIALDDIQVVDPATSPRREAYARYLWERRQRKGLSLGAAEQRLRAANYFGCCMVALHDADAVLSGVNATYPETIRPALETIGAHPKAGILSGMYMLVFDKRVVFCGDTTVNIDPTAEQLAQIALAAARIVRTFGEEPRVAMLSFSNFGSVRHPDAAKVARAVELVRARDPLLAIDGEMQADTALDPAILGERYPFSRLREEANVLIFPNLSAGNIAYKLLHHLGGATAIGPILVGMNRPVHVLEQGADVQEIVNMAAVAVMDAQARSRAADDRARVPDVARGRQAAIL